jgi:hypothetical protein
MKDDEETESDVEVNEIKKNAPRQQ